MDQAVVEQQGHSRLSLDHSRFEARRATAVSIVQVDHEGKQTQLAVLAGEGTIRVPSKALAGRVAVKAKTLIQTASLSARVERSNVLTNPLPKVVGKLGVVDDHAVVVPSIGIDPCATRSID